MAAPPPAHSYYEATALRPDFAPPPDGDVRTDVCIVGGGLTGVSAALELAGRGFDVRLVDAGRIGGGASARNGGQINTGLAPGATGLLALLGRDDARRLFDLSEAAIDLIDERVLRHHIDCDLARGYIHAAEKPRQERAIAAEVECLARDFGINRLEWLDRGTITERVHSPRFIAGANDPRAGHIHTLDYCLGLARAAAHAGAMLHEGVAATAVDAATGVVTTGQGSIRADHVLVAANAYLDGLVPDIDAMALPVGTWVMTTQPLSTETRARLIPGNECVCDSNNVLDYFRFTADGRLLFGGGVSYRGMEDGPRAAGLLQRRLAKTFPELAREPAVHVWGGKVSITRNRLPHIGRAGQKLYFAHGFSGHGVAVTGLAGKLVAEAMAGDASGFDVFASIPHSPFPGGPHLRQPLVTLGRLWYRLLDLL
ncbi:MAG: FAD-binding oxidoreductase [Pseudomonadota bacterium]|nr:FAD-binding oxidoreductase [Pseudomonadota bacterium]